MLDGILLEKAGIPAIVIVTDAFVETGKVMASDWGLPLYRFLSIPHPVGNISDEALNERADKVSDEVIELLKKGQTN